ncbi:MAG: hypothetical protein Q7S73_01165 [bacterium]|nr:hypothetical protein [bacterium]
MFTIISKKLKSYQLPAEKGIAALPSILMFGGLITGVAIAISSVAYLFINSQLGIKLSSEALLVAKAGIQDASMRVVRDKFFSSALYTLTIGDNSVDITVCRDICVGVGKDQIISISKVRWARRKLEAIVEINSITGEVRLESLKELGL